MNAISLCLLMFIIGCYQCRATEIIAVKTPTAIVVGADSKVVNGSVTLTEPKIIQTGDVTFAASGLTNDKYLQSDYHQLIKQVLGDAGSPLDSRLKQMESVIIEKMSLTATKMRSIDPLRYAKYRNGVAILSVLVFRFDSTGPHMYKRHFVVQDMPDRVNVSLAFSDSCPGDCPTGPLPNLYAIGIFPEPYLAKFIDWDPKHYGTVDQIIDRVCEGISGTIAADPTEIGPPIQIVVIDRDGVHWQKPRQDCK